MTIFAVDLSDTLSFTDTVNASLIERVHLADSLALVDSFLGSVVPGARPQFWTQTILSQYANSPVLLALVQDFDTYINPSANIEVFYSELWDINTAQGYGLDVWGRILGVSRVVSARSIVDLYFGFTGIAGRIAASGDSFGNAASLSGKEPFFSGQVVTTNFTLTDTAYRVLLMAKALANICDGSIPAINQILINLFIASVPGRTGKAYVEDGLNMTMRYVFAVTPPLTPVEVTIVSQSNILPKPCGVTATVVQV